MLILSLLYTVRSDEGDEPSLHILARSTVYNVNETKAIFCKGRNIVEPIQWYSPSRQLIEERSTKNNRIFVESKTDDDGILRILIIHNINISDGGNWTCKAGNLSETRDFIVGEKVNLPHKHAKLTGEEENAIRLTCEANGYPAPVVVWYKEKQLIKDKENTKKYRIRPDHSLEIMKLNHADAGIYTCKVRQKVLSHYTEKTVELSVLHKPILYNSATQMAYKNQRYKTEEIYAILNDTKNITCSAIANPQPTYRWFKRQGLDDTEITDSETVIKSADGTSSVLVLRMYDISYFIEYKCSATNPRGTDSIIFHVTQGSKPNPPDSVSLFRTEHTALIFNVSCSNCTYANEEEFTPRPETILGFSFQLAVANKGYEPDWTTAALYDIDIDDSSNGTLYTVDGLSNNTKFYVQVRSRNAAGYSEWVDIPGDIATDHAVKQAVTGLLLFVTILFTYFY